jgi:hypothetical protein
LKRQKKKTGLLQSAFNFVGGFKFLERESVCKKNRKFLVD